MAAGRPDEVLSSDARPSSVISDDIPRLLAKHSASPPVRARRSTLREKNLASPPLRARRSTQREKKRTVCGAKPLADNQADLEEAVLARVRGRVAVGENVFLLLAGEGGRGATG
jgi:hypothetical protein